jgi:hypothetical protein
MASITKKHREIAATISDDLRREALEATRLQRCEHDHDFSALVTDIIKDLEVMAARYKDLLQSLYAVPTISEEGVNAAIHGLLKELPADYPPATFRKDAEGYWLEIDRTIIFREATGEEAIQHTANYVEARKNSPTLPVGVIYGIYD